MMQVTLEQLEPCKVALKIEVDAEAVNRALDRVFKEVANRVSVPGFRKGKAPRHILERAVSADLVRDQAISDLVPEHYEQALKEQNLRPVAKPEFEWEPLQRDQPFRFTATVSTQPEVRLCDYRDIPARRRRIEVTDQDVDLHLGIIRRRAARIEDAEETVAGPGMVGMVDLDAYRGERLLKNRSRQDVPINMDDTESVPAFNVVVDGMSIGETREMPVRYPATLEDPVLAGKEILYRITLKGLKRIVMPELDDEFARSQGAENLEELRAKARESLEATALETANREVREQVLEYVVARSEVHLPEAMLDEVVTDTLRDERKGLAERDITLEDYLKARGSDLAAHEREVREDARRRMRTQLVLDKIAEKEGITLSDEDVTTELREIGEPANASPEEVRRAMEKQEPGAIRNLRVRLIFRKAVDRLVEAARITEV